MQKRWLILAGVLLVGGLAFGFVWHWGYLPGWPPPAPIYLAVVTPSLNGDNRLAGQAVRRGLELYLQTAYDQKRLGGRPIVLKYFDDQDNPLQAAKLAAEIANDPNILLVLGHYFSSSALAASRLYQQKGLPAITASATVDAVTTGSEWYFRTIPNNTFQGQFIAAYIKHILRRETSLLIVDQDDYGASLAASYRAAAAKMQLTIRKEWGFERDKGDPDRQIRGIINELQAEPEPGIIFLATQPAQAVQIISTLKAPGTNYTFIGPDAFTSRTFIEEFQQLQQEQFQPGYYSNGIYAVTPFLAALATDQGQLFVQRFQQRYREEPGWEAACYYDALAVAVEAIKRAELEGGEPYIDRRNVRNALLALANGIGVPGVTGFLSFDAARNMSRPLMVGMYENQRLTPAFQEYPPSDNSADLTAAPPTFQQIIKTGITVNAISALDLHHAAYAIDFYEWFRFQGELPVADITFPDAPQVVLKDPIIDTTENGITTRVYHLKATFASDAMLTWYPAIVQLPVRVRQRIPPGANLRYIPDTMMRALTEQAKADKEVLDPATGWQVARMLPLVSDEATPAQQVTRFNLIIQLTSREWGFLIRNLLPLGVLFIMLGAVYFLPRAELAAQSTLIGAVLCAAILYDVTLRANFEGTKAMLFEYVVFAVYGLTALAAAVVFSKYLLRRRRAAAPASLMLAGRIIHCSVSVLVVVGFIVLYLMLPNLNRAAAIFTTATP